MPIRRTHRENVRVADLYAARDWREGQAGAVLGIHGYMPREIGGAKMQVPIVERAGRVVRLIDQDSDGYRRCKKVESRQADREAQLQ